MKYQFIGKQALDTSCGFSTVSGLLSNYWGIPVTERTLISNFIIRSVPEGRLTSWTTTLLDLSGIIASYGIKNKSYRLTWEQLSSALEKHSPAIVHYDNPRPHFLLAYCIIGDYIYLGDPGNGVQFLSKSAFMRQWSGIALFTASSISAINTNAVKKAYQPALKRKKLLDRITCRI